MANHIVEIVGARCTVPAHKKIKKVIFIKNQRGITLIALILTIVVALILVRITIKAGTDSLEQSDMISFVSRMQLIQKKVDFLVENGGYEELGTDLTQDQEAKIDTIITASDELKQRDNNSILKYFNKFTIASQLEIENIDDEIVVNFATREVISLSGIKYKSKMYYTQYGLPGGQTIKQNTTAVSRQIILENVTIIPNINGLNATFTITGIAHSNGTLSYSTNNQETWTEITNYTVANEPVTTQNLTQSGTYWFKWTDNTDKNNQFVLDDVNLVLTNSPKIKGNIEFVTGEEENLTYNYSDYKNNSPAWAYAVDNKGTEDETDDIEYVWIPRFAYNEDNEIEFLRGTSHITTKDIYLSQEGWTVPDLFLNVTGVWIDTTSYNLAGNTSGLPDILYILQNGTIYE